MKLSVLGCGRWGSFIAWYLATHGHEVCLWGPADGESFRVLSQTGKNEYVSLEKSILLTDDLKRALDFADTSVISIPSQELRGFMKEIKAERMSNTKMGKYVNVFSLWNEFSGISEPIHSRILHFFLSDNPMHGQGKLFLSAFLEYIGFEKDKGNEEWIITAEEGRVDVC